MMTVLQIQILLHYYIMGTPYAENDADHRNSPAVKEQTAGLLNIELLQKATLEGNYIVTDKGRVFIEMLKSTPMPVMKWVAP